MVNFICVSLMGDRRWMYMIFDEKIIYQIVSLCQCVSQKDNFTIIFLIYTIIKLYLTSIEVNCGTYFKIEIWLSRMTI